MKRIASLALALIATFSMLYAQKPASPTGTAEGTIGSTKIKIVYSQPSARGRKVMGGDLVPFGQVWRTGANAATTIEFDKAVKIEGKDLAAGKYALFTIAGEKEWTIIFSKKAEQNGAFDYKKEEDALRVIAPSKKTPAMVETFNISVGTESIELKWENTSVSVKVKG
ncbi:MAG: DUF2911 domain-containing protein [Chryseolinea sp.]